MPPTSDRRHPVTFGVVGKHQGYSASPATSYRAAGRLGVSMTPISSAIRKPSRRRPGAGGTRPERQDLRSISDIRSSTGYANQDALFVGRMTVRRSSGCFEWSRPTAKRQDVPGSLLHGTMATRCIDRDRTPEKSARAAGHCDGGRWGLQHVARRSLDHDPGEPADQDCRL